MHLLDDDGKRRLAMCVWCVLAHGVRSDVTEFERKAAHDARPSKT